MPTVKNGIVGPPFPKPEIPYVVYIILERAKKGLSGVGRESDRVLQSSSAVRVYGAVRVQENEVAVRVWHQNFGHSAIRTAISDEDAEYIQ